MGAFYFIRRALRDIKDNGLTHLLSIGTIAISFFLFASFLLVSINFDSFLQAWEKKVQIVLYLKDGVAKKRILQIEKEIQKQEEV